MKTSHKLLWGLFGLITISMMSVAIAMRLDLREHKPEDGNGQIEEKTIQVGTFSKLSASQGVNVVYQPGDKHEVRIVSDANLLDKVYVNVRSNQLTLSKDDDFGKATQLDLYVTSPEIEEITARNSAVIRVDSLLNQESLEVYVSNSASIHLLTVTQDLTLGARNSGTLYVSGETVELDASASSSAAIEAGDLLSQFADVSAEGSSTVKLRVSDRLVSTCNGSSSIWYNGPETLVLKANGRIQPIPFSIENEAEEEISE